MVTETISQMNHLLSYLRMTAKPGVDSTKKSTVMAGFRDGPWDAACNTAYHSV